MKRILALSALLALPAAGDIVAGLEDFGSVTLVDSIDCSKSRAQDEIHQFRDYPAGRSYVTNILQSATRVMHHVRSEETTKGQRSGAYVSWRVGKGKGLVPNDPYLLVVEYPDDAPRTVTLFDFAMGARHGYHTGFTVGVSMSPQVSVSPCYESVAVPFSREWKKLVEVVFPFEKSTQYNGGSRIPLSTEGFDVSFVLVSQDQATDSVGLAVRSIKLYRIDDYDAAKPEIHYPAGDAPRRHVTSREEMGDGDGLNSFTTPSDWYVGKARLMTMLAMDTWSKDLLEFGYLQTWGGNRRWGWGDNYYGELIDAMTAEGHYLLPIYEYHGSRGDGNTSWDNGGSLGYDTTYKPWTLESAKDASLKYKFSGQAYVYNCMADMTLPQTLVDLKDLMDRTILRFKNRGNFLGAWIRTRGGMPVGFSDKTIALFNSETGRSVTRSQLWNNGAYTDTQLYRAYREWWYGKRRDQLVALQAYMEAGGLADAKLFYHSTAGEDGVSVGQGVIEYGGASDTLYLGQTWRQMTGKDGTTSLPEMAAKYWTGLGRDGSNWGDVEACHATPHADPEHYTALDNVALSYPFNCVHTVAGSEADANFRNASGDLLMARHYSLDEFCANDYNLDEAYRAIAGYYTSDMDHAGRAVMCAEVMAMAVNDPTILGYLFGSNLDRLDAPYVREFNQNFLSLPATDSTVLLGGTCNDAVTVRRWTTSAGNYWAVINVTPRPVSGTYDLQTSKTRVWRTVNWGEVPVSNGKVSLTLQPYQMVCLTDVEPAEIVAPVFGDCGATNLAARTATFTVALTTLGENANGADVAWTLSPTGSVVSSGTIHFAVPGVATVDLAGLAPETAYSVTFEATSSTGKRALGGLSFKTARFPVALGVPDVETDSQGTTATASVAVTRADAAATLVLASGGATVATWPNVSVGSSYSGSFPVARGSTTPFAFKLVHEDPATGERYEAATGDIAVGAPMAAWLDIRFDRSGYDNWTVASGTDPAVGGTWTSTGGSNTTSFATDGGNRRLELAAGQGGYVLYKPSSASTAGRAVRVKGRAQLVAEPGVPETPASRPSPPLAGLALGDDDGLSLYGWTADGWVALEGAPVAENAWIDWNATVDFTASPATVSYGIGGTVLSNATTGAKTFTAAGSSTRLSGVVYEGNGVVDDFSGACFEPVAVEIREPDCTGPAGSVAMHPSAGEGEPGSFDFEVSLEGQPLLTWFTAFECENLDPNPANWVARKDSVLASADNLAAGTVPLSVTAETTSKFVKIVASDKKFSAGTKLSDIDR